jgi:hypothetical protein
MNHLWKLLPVVTFWSTWYTGYTLIRPTPFETWWGFPLMVTLVGLFFVSCAYAGRKDR